MKKLIVVGGATASGKTALAIQLAQFFRTEIVSADSRQFYRGMDIGTAKPSAAELAAVPHHFISFLEVTQAYSVGDFERDALMLLEKLYQHHDWVVLVGGSGLYLKAVYAGLDDLPAISATTRRTVQAGEQSGGLAWLQQLARQFDPRSFEKMDIQNPARLRRVVEVGIETGRALSDFQTNTPKKRPFQLVFLLLNPPRELLYARIDARVDTMIASGLEEEARRLYPYRHLPALQTVGYSEFFDFFDGKISRATTIEKIKQHSRNYAKRQVTWFRKHGTWQIVDAHFDPNTLLAHASSEG